MIRILEGDCRSVLATLPAGSVHCCVTSPPYFGLRDYGIAAQIGLEATPEAFVAELVQVFREVRRVLRDDATLWLNLGDSYGPNKQLLGMPWRVAFALQADGWVLRQEIIWAKKNCMPESVTDRCTKSHEQIFLLSKQPTYFCDMAAIAEEAQDSGGNGSFAGRQGGARSAAMSGGHGTEGQLPYGGTRNKRSVWTVATQPFKDAHFATFPPDLIEPCIKAGCPVGGTVLDPFGGAGTTGLVADRLQRDAVLIELNPAYAAMSRARLIGDAPLFAEVTTGRS